MLSGGCTYCRLYYPLVLVESGMQCCASEHQRNPARGPTRSSSAAVL
jgi:hypothetical protein